MVFCFRVHACLYFIAPTGHGLKPLDVEVMKKIHKKVNIIPVIGKADSCTVKEVNMFKTKVRQRVNSAMFTIRYIILSLLMLH